MWLFACQYSNFLRFYSNLLDVVFLIYDLTYLLQWQVMQYLIDFHHPHHVSIRPAVPRSFFTAEQSTTIIFVSCFHPAVQMCPFLTPAQSLPCTQLCSQSLSQPWQPQPPTSRAQSVHPKPCPPPVPPVWGHLGWSGNAVMSQLLMSLLCHSLLPGTHADFRKRYCHVLNSVSFLDTQLSFPGISASRMTASGLPQALWYLSRSMCPINREIVWWIS